MLLGREGEQAAVDGLLGRARAGEGGALLLRGEPGVGKSALLGYAADRAVGMRVLRACGVQAESGLAYATLQQLLRPVLDRVGHLPEPQARALDIAFGLAGGEPPERFLISVAALTLLSDVAAGCPVLCLADDLHWADTPSAKVLAFVARRLPAEPVALLGAARDGEGTDGDTAGVTELRLAPLPPDAAAALLDLRWGHRLAPAVRDRLVRTTGGNPLALIELPAALTADQITGREPIAEPLPLTAQLERTYLDRVRRREPRVQALLLLAAAEGAGRLATIRRAAEWLELNPGLLESGDLADLVRVEHETVVFRHPLVRSAIYQAASPAARQQAHRALAEALAGDAAEADRRAWHRAQAAVGPDEPVADELERAAQRTMRRAGHAAASIVLERAAQLSPSLESRAHRLAAAADAAWRGGDPTRTRALVDAAERSDPGEPAVRLDIDHLRGLIELRAGVPADGLAILLPAARQAVETDPHLAVRLLMAAGEAAFHSDDKAASPEIGRLLTRLPPDLDPHDALLVRLHRAVGRAGDPARLSEDFAQVEQLDDPDLLVWAGGIAMGLGDHALARRLRTRAAARARAVGAAGTLAWVLQYQATDELSRGRCVPAEEYADEGRRLALETGQRNIACHHQAILAGAAALRGRHQQAHRLAEETLAEAATRRLIGAALVTHRALGELALATGRPEDALDHLDALWNLCPPGHRGISLFAVPDLVEAAVRAGQPERCHQRLTDYLAFADSAGPPQVRALAARSRALLTSGQDATRHFEQALRLHTAGEGAFDRARTQLLYGEFLRRERHRIQARTHLRAALDTFEQLGTQAWAQRAAGELRATGETARRRDPSTLDQLTPQELQIVHAVAEGATNREIAAQLFISPRTVDYHLRKVFPKLGITSRTELIRLAANT